MPDRNDVRVWLDVPFNEKDQAKACGARWDPKARRWYAPRPGMASLDRWAAAPEVPERLPGEDRSFGSGLFVDLVPDSCWFTNVRSCVSKRDWERLRRMVLRRAGARCEVCGRGEDRAAQPRPRWLEVHERWAYDQARRVQSLRRLICLCTDCHTTTHYGFAQVRGMEAEAFAHLRSMTGMSEQEARVHVNSAFRLWQQRSQHVWALDLHMLTNIGVTVSKPPAANERATVAAEQTAAVRSAIPDPREAATRAAQAAELVRMMRAQGLPVDQSDAVQVRLPGGHHVTVDPRTV